MELEINGVTYRIDQMNVFDQWDVARRLLPVIGSLTNVKDENSLTENLTPLFQAVGKMSDEDTHFILHKCLAAVARLEKIDGSERSWRRILGAGDAMMFQDIDMPMMLRLTVTVIKENMGNFFIPAVLAGSVVVATKQ